MAETQTISEPERPIRVALVNDYELVVKGLSRMLAPFPEHVNVVELNANTTPDEPVDIALFDAFGPIETNDTTVSQLSSSKMVRKVVLYTWNSESPGVRAIGADAVLSKALTGEELVDALKAVNDGDSPPEVVIEVQDVEPTNSHHGDWPGRSAGLTMREAEMITMITMGYSNAEIAEHAFLSPNSVKSYIRSAYRKIGVTRRSQAVAWGIDNSMAPERMRRQL